MKVEERTQIMFSHFYQKKTNMVILTCVKFAKWKNTGMGVEHVWSNNTGENKLLETKANGEIIILASYLNTQYVRLCNKIIWLAELILASIENRGRG